MRLKKWYISRKRKKYTKGNGLISGILEVRDYIGNKPDVVT